MPETISLRGKRASATIFVSNLIMDQTLVAFLTAYGPSQEVRAFAQLLFDRDNPHLEAPGISQDTAAGGNSFLVSKMDNGYTGLYLTPNPERRLIIGQDTDECFGIYSRILDQQQFVHREWYRPLFDLAEEVEPQVGNKKCYRLIENIPNEVQNRIRYGDFEFPSPTAHFDLEVKQQGNTPTM